MQPTSGGSADVRATIETGFADLKAWLDARLRNQEDLLHRFSNARELHPTLHHVWSNGLADKDGIMPRPPEDDLRVASCGLSDKVGTPEDSMRLGPISESASEDAIQDVHLPGSMPEASPEVVQAKIQEKKKVKLAIPCTASGTLAAAEEMGSKYSPRPKTTFGSKFTLSSVSTSDKDAEGEPFTEQDWQSKLMDVFDQMDVDMSGSIDRNEFADAFEAVGLPAVSAFNVFSQMDTTSNGVIDRVEWLHMIEEAAKGSQEEQGLLIDFLERLANQQRKHGRIYDENHRQRRPFLILRHDSLGRMAWDLLMMHFG
jgi:hypothetical protein